MTGSEYRSLLKKSPHKARRDLFDEYYSYIYTIVRGRLLDFPTEETEECVSDVFAQVYIMLEDSQDYSGELRGIIATLAKRRATDRFRSLTSAKRKVTYIDDEEAELTAPGDTPEEHLEKEQLRDIIIGVIERLGKPDSEIIIRKYYYGQSSADIAATLEMKPSAVRMRCARAMKKLRAALKEHGINGKEDI